MSGGKGINVARVLSALGEDCIAVAPCGGEGGRLFSQLAISEGVQLISVPVSGNTRTIDTYARLSDYKQQVVREAGPELTNEEINSIRETVLANLNGCAVLAVCGSASCEKGVQLIYELILQAKARGVRTLLDSNGPALLEGAKAIPDVLKINESELAQLIDATDDPMHPEASRLTMEQGVGRVLLTLGERGCAQYLWEQVSFCPASKVECVNAVGSGDCFTAAWLHAQIRGFSDDGALLLANATFDIINKIGWPEGRIPLSECAIYLATSPKSNSAYLAIDQALQLVQQTGDAPVPLHLRNAPTKLMKQLGYGQDYKYAHDFPGHFVRQDYMPAELHHPTLWHPQDNPAEAAMSQRQRQRWGDGHDNDAHQS